MSQVKRIAIFFSLLLFFSLSALAQNITQIKTHKGFYLGLMGGYSFADYKNVTFLNGNTFGEIKENGVAPNIQAAYEFNRWVALELGIVYVHKPRFEQPNNTNGARSKIKSNIVYLVVKPRYVFNLESGQWYLFTKLGIGYVVTDRLNAGTSLAMRGDEYFRPVYGAGFGYRPTFHWQVEAAIKAS